MAKSRFLKLLTNRNRQSKYSKMQVMKKATAIILAFSLGLGTTAPTFTYAKENTTVVQTIDAKESTKLNNLDKDLGELKVINKSQLPKNLNGHLTFFYEGNPLQGQELGGYLTTKVKELVGDLDFTILSPNQDSTFYQVYVVVRADQFSYIDTRLFTIQFVQVNDTNKEAYEKLNAMSLPAVPFTVDSTFTKDKVQEEAEKYLSANTNWKTEAESFGYDMHVTYKIYARMEDRVEVTFKKKGTNEDTGIIKVIPINYVVNLKEDKTVDTAKYFLSSESDKITTKLENQVREELKITKDFLSYLDYKVAVQKTDFTTYQVVVSEADGGTDSQTYHFTKIYDCSEFDFGLSQAILFDEEPTDDQIQEVLKTSSLYQDVYEKITNTGHDIKVENRTVYLTLDGVNQVNLGKVTVKVKDSNKDQEADSTTNPDLTPSTPSTDDKGESDKDGQDSDESTDSEGDSDSEQKPPVNDENGTGGSENSSTGNEDQTGDKNDSTELPTLPPTTGGGTVTPMPTPPADEESETPDSENGTIIETDKEINFESVGQVDKDGNVQSSYEITSDALSKVFEEKKNLVLTDKTSGAQVELGSKAINPKELASVYGKDVTVSVHLSLLSDNTFKIEATAKGSLKEGKLEEFKDQMKITFDKKASKASLAYSQEIAMQKVDGKLVHIPHQINGNKVSVRTYNTGEIVLTNASIKFKDIAKDANKQTIENLGVRGIVKGVGNDLYVPNRELTRAEFATMVARALGLKAQGENTFTDIKEGWYYDSVIALTEANLIKGVGNNKFQPNSYITGEEIAVIMHRMIELELGKVEINNQLAGDVSGFSTYAKEAIAGLRTVGISTEGIVKGKTFNRSQMAKLLADTMKKVNLM